MSQGHAVVDGSNIATEGRSTPSLAQLDEAVTTFIEQYDFEYVTVIVDATFEHRVEDPEREAAKAAIDGSEIITPPAGVIGRGDAFILQVADKANAVVLSNDSFQEFHGTYDWLFDDGRLVGGKPIPGVGWIFVPRSPVRGPVSRRAVRQSAAMEPAPPNPKIGDSRRASKSAKAKPAAKASAKSPATRKPAAKASAKSPAISKPGAPKKKSTTNSLAAWRSFRSDYPEGSTVAAQVDRFSSHGAYGSVDRVNVYIPLSLLGDPAPRRARDLISLGETRDFVVDAFDEARRSIDVGLVTRPGNLPVAKKTPQRKPTTKKAPVKKAAAKKAPARKVATGKVTASKSAAKKPTTKKSASPKAAQRKAAVNKTPVEQTATKKTPASKVAARKAAAKRAPAKKTVTKTQTSKKAASPKAASPKTAVKKTPVKKATAKRVPAQKAVAKRPTTKKAVAKKPANKKAGMAKKPRAKRPAVKKSATRRSSAK